MTADPLAALREHLHQLADLQAICGLLYWDQETMMPPAGAYARADHVATLDRLLRERLKDVK